MLIQIVRPDDRPRGIRRCGASLRIPGRDFPSLQSSESVEFFLPHPLNPQSAICDPQSRLLLLLFFFRSSCLFFWSSFFRSRRRGASRLAFFLLLLAPFRPRRRFGLCPYWFCSQHWRRARSG